MIWYELVCNTYITLSKQFKIEQGHNAAKGTKIFGCAKGEDTEDQSTETGELKKCRSCSKIIDDQVSLG